MKQELIYPDLSYEMTGILFKTQNELGRYCNEKQYADYIEGLLKENKVVYKREMVLPVSFKEENVGRNRVDFLIEDKIVIELKCKRITERNDYYQVKRYLAACNKKLGLLVNFREKYLRPKRIINSQYKNISD